MRESLASISAMFHAASSIMALSAYNHVCFHIIYTVHMDNDVEVNPSHVVNNVTINIDDKNKDIKVDIVKLGDYEAE